MTTANYSPALNVTAKLSLAAFPDVEFATIKTPVPSIRLHYPKIQTSRLAVPMPPSSIQYSPFNIEFIIMNDCSNYRTIIDWMQNAINKPATKIFSDGTLSLMGPARNIVQQVQFQDLMPVEIGEVIWRTDVNAVDFQVVSCTFDYTQFAFI